MPLTMTSGAPISSAYLTQIIGHHSHWVQPWRGYLDTWPVSVLQAALGIQFHGFTPSQADNTARLLAANGWTTARLSFNWDVLDYDVPTTFTSGSNNSSIRRCQALVDHGLRPLIELNASHGAPCPLKAITLTTTGATAPIGATTVQLDAPSAALVVPGKTGFDNVTGGSKAASVLITSVNGSNVATLAKPLEETLAAGGHAASTLKHEPFTKPLISGNPNPRFEATVAGWLSYVDVVLDQVTAQVGSQNFDVEIWNELTFASDFLNIWFYYSPTVPDGNVKADTTATRIEILARTVAQINTSHPGVRIGNGFANTITTNNAEMPAGLDAIDDHPYPKILTMPADFADLEGRAINALGVEENPEMWNGSAVSAVNGPVYHAAFAETGLSAFHSDHLIRDIAPITTTGGAFQHGRNVTIPGGTLVQKWITENQTKAPTGADAATIARHRAKDALRVLVSFVAKGCSMVQLSHNDTATDSMIASSFYAGTPYPGDNAGGLAIDTMKRFITNATTGAATITSTRALTLTGVGDYGNRTQFTGDGSAAHPTLFDREVATFFPFQVSNSRFVASVHVMTRDQHKTYGGASPNAYDLPLETYRYVIGGFTSNPTVTGYDPLSNSSVAVNKVAWDGTNLTIELPVNDSPRLVSFVESTPVAPVANFTGTPLTGTAPLNVSFTDTSTNTPTSWAWDFDNSGGAPDSTVQNPSHIYATPGTYTVKLTATNAAGSDPDTKTSYITVIAGGSGSEYVDLSWTASTDVGSGVNRYELQRALASTGTYAALANTTTTTYRDSTVTLNTSYLYRLRAVDNFGNPSAWVLCADNPIDVGGGTGTSPGAPIALNAAPFGSAMIFTWDPPATGTTPTLYLVEHNLGSGFTQIGTTPASQENFADDNPNQSAGSSTDYRVRARDGAGNTGPYSATRTGTFPPDTEQPTAPTNVVASATGPNAAQVTWNASSDDWAVQNYDVQLDTSGTVVVTGTSHSRSSISAGAHTFRVRARDGGGNLSGWTVSNSFVASDPGQTGVTHLMPLARADWLPASTTPPANTGGHTNGIPQYGNTTTVTIKNDGDLEHSNSEVLRAFFQYVTHIKNAAGTMVQVNPGDTIQFRRLGQTTPNTAGTGIGRYHVPQGMLIQRNNINVDFNGCEVFTGFRDWTRDASLLPKYTLSAAQAAPTHHCSIDRFKWEPPSWTGSQYRDSTYGSDHPSSWPQPRVTVKVIATSGNTNLKSSRPTARLIGSGRYCSGGKGVVYSEQLHGGGTAGDHGGNREFQHGIQFRNGNPNHAAQPTPPLLSTVDITNIDVCFVNGDTWSTDEASRNIVVKGVNNAAAVANDGGAVRDLSPSPSEYDEFFVMNRDSLDPQINVSGIWVPGAATPGMHHTGRNIATSHLGSFVDTNGDGNLDTRFYIRNVTFEGFSIYQCKRTMFNVETEVASSNVFDITVRGIYSGQPSTNFFACASGGQFHGFIIEDNYIIGGVLAIFVQAHAAEEIGDAGRNSDLIIRRNRTNVASSDAGIVVKFTDNVTIEDNWNPATNVQNSWVGLTCPTTGTPRNANVRLRWTDYWRNQGIAEARPAVSGGAYLAWTTQCTNQATTTGVCGAMNAQFPNIP